MDEQKELSPEDEKKLEEANKRFQTFQEQIRKELGVQFQLQLVITPRGILPSAAWARLPEATPKVDEAPKSDEPTQ